MKISAKQVGIRERDYIGFGFCLLLLDQRSCTMLLQALMISAKQVGTREHVCIISVLSLLFLSSSKVTTALMQAENQVESTSGRHQAP
jgi:hypothetical protein